MYADKLKPKHSRSEGMVNVEVKTSQFERKMSPKITVTFEFFNWQQQILFFVRSLLSIGVALTRFDVTFGTQVQV